MIGSLKNGFSSVEELAKFIYENSPEKEAFLIVVAMNTYSIENKVNITEENSKLFFNDFIKNKKNQPKVADILTEIIEQINNHHKFFTDIKILKTDKKLLSLQKTTGILMDKFWGVDLLDEHIIYQYIEKYLFMGQAGINNYIRKRLSCPQCKYLGVQCFPPEPANMSGHDEGLFSGNYIFNSDTIKILSKYFDSTFLIIKPYATKGMVVQYIEDNWDSIEEHLEVKNTFYKQFEVTPTLAKEGDYEKNRLVYELNKLSKKELLKKYNGTKNLSLIGVYKESIVSAILEEEYNIKMSPEAIKKGSTHYMRGRARKYTKKRSFRVVFFCYLLPR